MNAWFYIVSAIIVVIAAIAAFFLGITYRKKVSEREISSAEEEAKRIINEAIKTGESKQREALLEAKESIHKERTEYEREVKERRSELQKQERRLQQKEENLDKKTDNIEKKNETLTRKIAEADSIREEIKLIKRSELEMLEKISGYSQEEVCNKALSRSFAINVAEKSVINDNPNTVIPGVRVLISNSFTGMFACRLLKSTNNTNGNPRPNPKLIGSRKISLLHLFANVNILIPRPPLQ